MNRATQLDSDRQARAAGLKFAFANGARPLSGYVIKRGVGRGGFGEVYYAVSDAGKEVALKLIRRNLDVELRGVTHCLNLKHPNLVSLFDVRQDDEENSWVVMEYVAGESLEEVIARHPQGMPVDDVLQWMQGIAAGVSYLHDHGIVHRDLKPGNIFVDEGYVKLGDYGLSKFISCSRRSGQTESVGTVHYMAPEVANGRYGKEIDVYALGIILYEMLTGRVPFEGESVGEVLMKHLTAEPDLSRLEEPFRTVVGRALAKDPLIRTRSVADLMAGLPAAAVGPLPAAPVSFVGAASPRRAPTAAGERPHPPPPPPPPHENPSPSASLADEEPIARTLAGWLVELRAFWTRQELNTPAKVVVLVVGVWFLAINATWMVPVLGTLAVAYGGYRLVRAVVLHGQARRAGTQWLGVAGAAAAAPDAPAVEPSPAVARAEPAPAERRRRRWHRTSTPPLPLRPWRERLAELLGSLLMAAGVAATLAIVMLLFQGEPPRVEQWAWLALTGTLGAWVVLIAAKLWEGASGDAARRRFTQMVLGLGLGAASYYLHDLVMADLHFSRPSLGTRPLLQEMDLVTNDWVARFHGPHGSPSIYAFLAYFALLLLVLRWWRQADRERSARLSLWSTAWTTALAVLATYLMPFPEVWAALVAATMSITIQLTSPWQTSAAAATASQAEAST